MSSKSSKKLRRLVCETTAPGLPFNESRYNELKKNYSLTSRKNRHQLMTDMEGFVRDFKGLDSQN